MFPNKLIWSQNYVKAECGVECLIDISFCLVFYHKGHIKLLSKNVRTYVILMNHTNIKSYNYSYKEESELREVGLELRPKWLEMPI